ncbi:hypothetical protein [Haloglomus litoreum]|nr:hypothetical protein [Haloglomus sp. DT116]
MQDAPGVNCGCGDESTRRERASVCSTCGSHKEWVSHGPSAVVFECPDCE